MPDLIDLDYPPKLGEQGIRDVPYETEVHDFAGSITRLLLEKGLIEEPVSLDLVHRHVAPDAVVVDEHGLNGLTRAFYDTDAAFEDLYLRFVKHLVGDVLGFDCIYQRQPTVRFHCPGAFPDIYKSAEGRMLGYHSDTMLGHPFEEINVWLPATDCYGTNAMVLSSLSDGRELLEPFLADLGGDADTYHSRSRPMWLEKLRSDTDYVRQVVERCPPYPMSYGSVLLFDPRCMHGTDENREVHTRISLDFRLIPVEAEEAMTREYVGTGRSKRKFARGDVYAEKSALEA